jgi:hypothetical protein
MIERPFTPSEETATIIQRLLDIYERRGGHPKQVVRVRLADMRDDLPGYYSQVDPLPRAVANEQTTAMAQRGWVAVHWEPGQEEHLLAAVDLAPEAAEALYTLVDREPLAAQRKRLRNLLLGRRFRVHDWRRLAIDGVLDRLKADRSPSPFRFDDETWNHDVLDALLALPENPTVETPYRVFSVRVFNDSKRFDTLKHAVARLARRHHTAWRELNNREILRELGLVPNPSHLYLAGPWRLTDGEGRQTALGAFHPSVGIPASLAAQVTDVAVTARRVICVENLTTFYELVRRANEEVDGAGRRGADLAALCLLGNPSPACRHLLQRLAAALPPDADLYLWADLDYGGLNILSQLRHTVSPRFRPYRMDTATLEAFTYWGQPLTERDRRNLARLRDDPHLADMTGVIDALLAGDVKLEQEAIVLREV